VAVTEEETASNLSDSSSSGSAMRVQKRDKSLQPVDVNKIVRAVERCATGLAGVDPLRMRLELFQVYMTALQQQNLMSFQFVLRQL